MAAPAPKQEELQPHAVRDQLPSVSYCLTSPPPWRTPFLPSFPPLPPISSSAPSVLAAAAAAACARCFLDLSLGLATDAVSLVFNAAEAVLLGFQHYLVMLGTTVIIPTALVPQMGGGNEEKARVVQTLLFVAGINTLIQSFLGTRLPAVMGASYTFVAPTISIILAGRYSGIADPHEKFVRIMRGTQGALIVASTLQIIMGFSGLWRIVVRLLSPLSAAPLVALVGFGLYELGFPSVAKCVEIGLPQILLLVALSQYIPHLVPLLSTAFERFAVIMSIALIWLYAFFLTVGGAYKNAAPKTQFHCRTDRSGLVGGAPWISVPYPFQWGAPTFDAGEAFAMMAASFVALVESTGAFIAISRYASATPCPPSVMSRGIGWQGVGILLGGLFGTANGTSVSVENAGLLGLTRVGSRRVVQISAGFMIFFSILGMAGVGFLQFCNLNSFQTKFILGFSLFMGLSVPQYFNEYTSVAGFGPVHTHARWTSWFWLYLLLCTVEFDIVAFALHRFKVYRHGCDIVFWCYVLLKSPSSSFYCSFGTLKSCKLRDAFPCAHVQFNDMINVVFSSKAFVAGAVAYFLDNTLHRRDGTVRKDRGHHFWDRFRSFKTDPRSEEFYSLPFNLNKFFPSF
ncbi:unnamed protein product [Miscanthus lutarioriparius]|uniref:Nucleobase-ascorbate transporter 6 n=1 Tax=Miscanthus lutarioriparius TaxID=422564 RepID=A0A811MJT2_9POAL|nr:unnamed protein product [Miscanthus lutarioriparius]